MPASLAALGYAVLALNLALEAREKGRQNSGGSGLPTGGLAAARRKNAFSAALNGGSGSPVRRRQVFTIDGDALAKESPTMRRGPAKGKVESVSSLAGRVQRIRGLIRKGAVDPAVRKLAGAILARRCPGTPGGWCVKEKDWEGEAKALFGFVRSNVRYTRDSVLADTYVHPARTLFDRLNPKKSGSIGDCDDYVITLGALLAAVGHTPIIRVVAADDDDWNHIFLVDQLPAGGAIAGTGGKKLVLDASVNQPAGWEVPKARVRKQKDFPIV